MMDVPKLRITPARRKPFALTAGAFLFPDLPAMME